MSHSEKKSLRKGGPRTSLGKLRASQNSRKLGLFAKEFNLSQEEKSEFADLRKMFREGLKPDSSVLELLFEDVLACFWRMKISLRGEQLQLRRHLETQNERRSDALAEEEFPLNFPYRMTAGELRRRLKFVEDLEGIVSQEYPLGSDVQEPVSKALGPEFWKMLEEFTPENIIALHLYVNGVEQDAFFGFEPPGPKPTPEQEEKYRKITSSARIQMRTKLVQLEKLNLQLALRYLEQKEDDGVGTAASSDRLDLFLRYASTARREFYRTLNSYLEIKKRHI